MAIDSIILSILVSWLEQSCCGNIKYFTDCCIWSSKSWVNVHAVYQLHNAFCSGNHLVSLVVTAVNSTKYREVHNILDIAKLWYKQFHKYALNHLGISVTNVEHAFFYCSFVFRNSSVDEMLLISKDLASNVLMSSFTVIQHAADERIRLEELRRKVVSITVTRSITLTMFYSFILIVL